jgi:ABC-type branched-subunit amino acid transport system substrate-binding protein
MFFFEVPVPLLFPQSHLRAALLAVVIAFCTWLESAVAEPFLLGVSAPLTGDAAAYGRAVRNGFAMSEADNPDSSVRMVFEDNRYEAKEALSAFRKLVDQQKVDLLFSWGEAPLNSTASLIERLGVPTIAMSLDPVPCYGKKSLVVSVNHPAALVSSVLSELRKGGAKSFGFLVTEDPFFKAVHREFEAQLRPGETAQLVGNIAPGDIDLRSLTLKASRGKFDAIGVYLAPGQVRAFYREAGRINFKPTSFGTDVFENREEINAAGNAMRGAIYPNLKVPSDFRKRYVEAYKGDDEISFAYNAYIVGRWIHSTFGDQSKLNKLSKDEIMARLETSPVDAGVKLSLSSHGSRHLNFPITVRRIIEGGFE